MARLLSAFFPFVALFAAAAGAQPPAMREVNITSDSAPGWLPSVAQEAAARTVLDGYFVAIEAGDDRRAYAMMIPGQQAVVPFADFAAGNAAFRTLAGALRDRRVLKLTWTKDPARAPRPGIYAAFDVAARYANVDRQCGYVILYQEREGAPFGVARTESNSIDDATAREIERTRGRAGLDQVWAELSSRCPNYLPIEAR